jgi:hypothetical protein
MVFTPFSAREVLAAARQLCRENKEEVAAAIDEETANVAAAKIVADANMHDSSQPIGVAIAAALQRAGRESANADTVTEAAAAAGPPLTEAERALKRKGPASSLSDCPYCTDPSRRFCPESGRRHETSEERGQRLWRAMFRQLQFHSRMADLGRLEKPNTCAEEFYVEI